MKDIVIQGIFPLPVYLTNLNRNFSKSELAFFKKNRKTTYRNEGNTTSNDNYVLYKPPLKKLKQQLDHHIISFFEKVYSPRDPITPYITQSWINYTDEKEHHHAHEHPNSLVSGVLYLDADINFDGIKFYKKDRYATLKFTSKEYNTFNSDTWSFPVETGDLILFPSFLTHGVTIKKGKNTRMSLAFNVFIRGLLGNNKELTELKL